MARFVIGILLVGCVGWVYRPVLYAGFLSRDDGEIVRQAARISSLSGTELLETFQGYTRPSDSAGVYQPLALLSLAMDARLTTDFGAPAFQFHLTSLTLHLLNTALVYGLLLSLLSPHAIAGSQGCKIDASSSRDIRAVVWAALLTLLFGLHPVQVESVCWISQRGILLGMCFALLSMLAYVRHVRSVHAWWLAPATAAYLAAVLCMPQFIGLPVLMLVLDLWPARREGWRPFIEKLPMFVVLLAAGIVQVMVVRHIPPRPEDAAGNLTLLLGSLAGFFERIVWPAQLSPFYPLLAAAGAVPSVARWTVICLLLLGAGVWSFRHCRPLFLAICGMFLMLCPALLNVAYGTELLGDRYLYAALLAPLIAVAAWLRTSPSLLARPAQRLSAVCIAAVASVYAVHAYSQTFVWQSSRDLYEHTIARYPTWPRAHTGLVEAYLQENEFDSALYHAERAAKIAPQDPTTQFYLGTTLLLHHGSRSAEAIAPLQRALQSNPNWIACLQNLGIALARSGQTEQAIEYLERARDLEPESASIRIGLGHAYLRVQRPASARRELQEALRRQNNPTIHLGLAMAWAAIDAPEQARRHIAAALAKDPRLAARIAATPELRDLGGELDFEHVLPDPFDAWTDPETIGAELPAARNARGT